MSQQEINEIGQFIPLHYHYQMLSDPNRMTTFRTAIEKVITPNHKVTELGSGTGVLSYFAAKQGAQVWSVEFNPSLVEVSRKFLADNNVGDKVHVSQGNAFSWLPPEPVDWVICEMLHSALLREKQLQVISTFRDAHIARFGKSPNFLPNATLLGVQPVLQCYDFQGYKAPVPLFQSPYITTKDCVNCSNPVVYKVIDYSDAKFEEISGDVTFSFQEDTNINALRFITKNLLTMDFSTGQMIDWHNQYLVLPLSHSIVIGKGETLRVRFKYNPGDPIEVLSYSINESIFGSKFEQKIQLEDYPTSPEEEIPVISLETRGNTNK